MALHHRDEVAVPLVREGGETLVQVSHNKICSGCMRSRCGMAGDAPREYAWCIERGEALTSGAMINHDTTCPIAAAPAASMPGPRLVVSIRSRARQAVVDRSPVEPA